MSARHAMSVAITSASLATRSFAGAALPADTAVPDDVQADLDAIRADLANLRRAQGEAWIDERRAAEIRALVSDVLSDSSARTQWAGPGDSFATGYDPSRGFFMGSADAQHSVHAFGFTQVRFNVSNGYDAAERTPSSETTWGMEVRRAQLFLGGNLDGPGLTWLIGLSIGAWNDPVDLQLVQQDPASVNGTPASVSYLNVTKQLGDGLYVQVGSIFTPFTYESHLFSTAQTQMGECSMIEWLFTAAFTTGVSVGQLTDSVMWQTCFGNQVGTAPSEWDGAENQSIAMTGRLNWKLCGTWEQYLLETSFPDQPFGAFVGVAGRMENGRAANAAVDGGANPSALTGDVALMFGGANLILQGIWADQWTSRGSQSWGGLVQGGWFLGPAVESFASFAIADVVDIQSTLSTGLNWYIDRSSLKLTGRVMIPLAGSPDNFTSAVLPPQGLSGGDHPNNNVGVSVQLQASF